MMPVIRISDRTWERLKKYARPLEDTADDVVNRALDALEKGGVRKITPEPNVTSDRKRRSNKLPQKEFRLPLLETLQELGGKAEVKRIRKRLEPKIAARLSDDDRRPVSTGEPRWWNAACWERKELVEEGLLRNDSERGVWELSAQGLEVLARR